MTLLTHSSSNSSCSSPIDIFLNCHFCNSYFNPQSVGIHPHQFQINNNTSRFYSPSNTLTRSKGKGKGKGKERLVSVNGENGEVFVDQVVRYKCPHCDCLNVRDKYNNIIDELPPSAFDSNNVETQALKKKRGYPLPSSFTTTTSSSYFPSSSSPSSSIQTQTQTNIDSEVPFCQECLSNQRLRIGLLAAVGGFDGDEEEEEEEEGSNDNDSEGEEEQEDVDVDGDEQDDSDSMKLDRLDDSDNNFHSYSLEDEFQNFIPPQDPLSNLEWLSLNRHAYTQRRTKPTSIISPGIVTQSFSSPSTSTTPLRTTTKKTGYPLDRRRRRRRTTTTNEDSFDNYVKSISSRYPIICKNCLPKVEKIIKRKDYRVRAERFGRKLSLLGFKGNDGKTWGKREKEKDGWWGGWSGWGGRRGGINIEWIGGGYYEWLRKQGLTLGMVNWWLLWWIVVLSGVFYIYTFNVKAKADFERYILGLGSRLRLDLLVVTVVVLVFTLCVFLFHHWGRRTFKLSARSSSGFIRSNRSKQNQKRKPLGLGRLTPLKKIALRASSRYTEHDRRERHQELELELRQNKRGLIGGFINDTVTSLGIERDVTGVVGAPKSDGDGDDSMDWQPILSTSHSQSQRINQSKNKVLLDDEAEDEDEGFGSLDEEAAEGEEDEEDQYYRYLYPASHRKEVAVQTSKSTKRTSKKQLLTSNQSKKPLNLQPAQQIPSYLYWRYPLNRQTFFPPQERQETGLEGILGGKGFSLTGDRKCNSNSDIDMDLDKGDGDGDVVVDGDGDTNMDSEMSVDFKPPMTKGKMTLMRWWRTIFGTSGWG